MSFTTARDNILYPPTNIAFASSVLVAESIGILSNTVALLVVLLDKKLRNSASNLFTLSILFGNMLLAMTTTLNCLGMLISGGWWSGVRGCMVNAFLNIMASALMVLSLVGMAFERYRNIVLANPMSVRETRQIIGMTWIIAGAVAFFPVGVAFILAKESESAMDIEDRIGLLIAIQPSGIYCAVNWASDLTVQRLFTGSVVCVLFVCIGILIACYTLINEKIKNIGQESRRTLAFPSLFSKKAGQKVTKLERFILKKSIIMVFAFLSAWVPFNVVALYQMIRLQAVTPLTDVTFVLIVAANVVTGPIIIIVLDERYKRSFLKNLLQREILPSYMIKQEGPLPSQQQVQLSAPLNVLFQMRSQLPMPATQLSMVLDNATIHDNNIPEMPKSGKSVL